MNWRRIRPRLGRRTAPRRSIVYFGFLGDGQTDAHLVMTRLCFMDRQLRWLSELVGPGVPVVVAYTAPTRSDPAIRNVIRKYGFRVDTGSTGTDRRNRASSH